MGRTITTGATTSTAAASCSPTNYVTLKMLQERWLKQKQDEEENQRLEKLRRDQEEEEARRRAAAAEEKQKFSGTAAYSKTPSRRWNRRPIAPPSGNAGVKKDPVRANLEEPNEKRPQGKNKLNKEGKLDKAAVEEIAGAGFEKPAAGSVPKRTVGAERQTGKTKIDCGDELRRGRWTAGSQGWCNRRGTRLGGVVGGSGSPPASLNGGRRLVWVPKTAST